jgi:hypothetical protein
MRQLFLAALIGLVAACGNYPSIGQAPSTDHNFDTRPEQKAPPKGGGDDGGEDERVPVPMPAPADEPADPPPRQPDPPRETDVQWLGTLETTDWVTFGGEPFCDYRGRFGGLQVKVTMSAANSVAAVVVTGSMIEETVGTCPFPAEPPHAHSYTFAPVVPDSSLSFAVPGSPDNAPRAELLVTLDMSEDGPTAALRLHRVDLTAPFDWVFEVKVPLKKL